MGARSLGPIMIAWIPVRFHSVYKVLFDSVFPHNGRPSIVIRVL